VCLSDMTALPSSHPTVVPPASPEPATPLPMPTPLPEPRDPVEINDTEAIEAIHRLLNRPGDWDSETLDEVTSVLTATGRRIFDAIDLDVSESVDDGEWPVVRVDAFSMMTIFVRQARDGGICLDVFPQNPDARKALRILMDGQVLHGPPLPSPAPQPDTKDGQHDHLADERRAA